MRKFIVSCSLLLAIGLSMIFEYLYSSWSKSYFTMVFCAIFFLYWAVELTLDFVAAQKEYPQRFALYSAEQVNKLDIPLSQIEAQHKKYYNAFKRSIFKERAWQITKFLLFYGATIAIIIAMAL